MEVLQIKILKLVTITSLAIMSEVALLLMRKQNKDQDDQNPPGPNNQNGPGPDSQNGPGPGPDETDDALVDQAPQINQEPAAGSPASSVGEPPEQPGSPEPVNEGEDNEQGSSQAPNSFESKQVVPNEGGSSQANNQAVSESSLEFSSESDNWTLANESVGNVSDLSNPNSPSVNDGSLSDPEEVPNPTIVDRTGGTFQDNSEEGGGLFREFDPEPRYYGKTFPVSEPLPRVDLDPETQKQIEQAAQPPETCKPPQLKKKRDDDPDTSGGEASTSGGEASTSSGSAGPSSRYPTSQNDKNIGSSSTSSGHTGTKYEVSSDIVVFPFSEHAYQTEIMKMVSVTSTPQEIPKDISKQILQNISPEKSTIANKLGIVKASSTTSRKAQMIERAENYTSKSNVKSTHSTGYLNENPNVMDAPVDSPPEGPVDPPLGSITSWLREKVYLDDVYILIETGNGLHISLIHLLYIYEYIVYTIISTCVVSCIKYLFDLLLVPTDKYFISLSYFLILENIMLQLLFSNYIRAGCSIILLMGKLYITGMIGRYSAKYEDMDNYRDQLSSFWFTFWDEF